MTREQEDNDLIDLCENLESRMTGDKAGVDWLVATDFLVFKNYLIKDIKEIQANLAKPNDDYLHYVCQHIFNIQDWIKLIVEDAGFPTFGSSWEHVFHEEFGDEHVLQNIYNTAFEKWIINKSGQYELGVNSYNVKNGKLFYRDRLAQWFEVDKATAFDVKPGKIPVDDQSLIEILNSEYKVTRYDYLLERWSEKEFSGKLPDDFLQFSATETSPDEYFDFTVAHIKKLLENPVSILELERWYGENIAGLEDVVKIVDYTLGIASKRRKEKSHTLYLLRDSLLFLEAHKTLDILSQQPTSSDKLLIGRKLLSHKPGNWGYYVITLEALYTAHKRYPKSFTDFFNEYSRLLDLCISANPKFAAVVVRLSKYVEKRIPAETKRIDVFDIGFQGSISLFVKYMIDRSYAVLEGNHKPVTDIRIGVGAQWSKELFGYRYDGDYFPMLNRIQLMTRSDSLYQYKDGSIDAGEPRVIMSDDRNQCKAAVELVVLEMIALITREDNK